LNRTIVGLKAARLLWCSRSRPGLNRTIVGLKAMVT